MTADDLPLEEREASPRRYVEASGERIALFGDEWGTYEAWAWPFKLFEGLRVDLERADEPLGPWALGRTVRVTPVGFGFRLEGRGIRATQEFFAVRDRAAVAIVTHYEEGPAPLELAARVRCDLRPVWPAGLGGEIARVDPASGLFCLTEERGRFAALFGGDGFALEAAGTDHAVPTESVRLVAPLEPGETRVLVLAASSLEPEPLSAEARLGRGQSATGFARAERNVGRARTLHRAVAAEHAQEAADLAAAWSAALARWPRLSTSDPRLDDAHRWALVSIQRAWIEVDGVGRGLVAGIAPSKGGARPGYAWFFDGDALVAARALTVAGEWEDVRTVLRFAASHQREDGKLMHELTLSARLCDWVEEYPYAYYKGLNAADFVVTLGDFVRSSGDLALARELWPVVGKALAWCRGCCGDDGLMRNDRAGIAAVEAGPLSDRIEVETFLNGTYCAALDAAVELAAQLEEHTDGRRFADWRTRASSGFESLWSEARGRYAFGRLDDGTLLDDLTAYHGVALERGLGTTSRAVATAHQLAAPELMADWGARMFATDSEVYDPEHYNTGAVFPYLTGFCVRGLYRYGTGEAAHQLALEQAALTHFGGLGFLEEHLVGDTATIPARGVPHQIFSSSQVVETAHVGLFGLRPDAVHGRLGLAPLLPPDWSHARLERVRVGSTVLDVEVRRERREARSERTTTTTVEVRRTSGPPVTLDVTPRFPPASRLRTLEVRVDGAPTAAGRGELEPEPSGSMRLRSDPVIPTEELTVVAVVEEGPALVLPTAAPVPGSRPAHPRLVERVVTDAEVRFTLAVPAGTPRHVRLSCDRPFETDVALDDRGGIELAAGAAGGWERFELPIRFQD